MFFNLISIFDFFSQESSKETRQRKISIVIGRFKRMADNVRQFIFDEYGQDFSLTAEETVILENSAVCLSSFLNQIKNEKKLTILSPTCVAKALVLIEGINKYHTHRDRPLEEIVFSAIRDIYFCFYRTDYKERQMPPEFMNDFVVTAEQLNSPEQIRSYVDKLEKNWIKNEPNHRRLDRKIIMAIMTIKNIFHHLSDNWNNDNEEIRKNIDIITGHLNSRDFEKICIHGLTYRKKIVEQFSQETVEAIYKDAEHLAQLAWAEKNKDLAAAALG
ncbi:MAG: hypothetical protein JXA92_01105 [candidate division Zixibacteria bacterium]|nr:hypothetical protein [candidate division Zixibacteria bacterium]